MPRATELSNHFGANPFASIYGPRPRLINREALIKNPDGSVVSRRIRLIENASSLRGETCDITKKDYFYYCMNISDCDICSSSPYCGWCEQASQCLPGHVKDTACPGDCVNGWFFTSASCNGKVKSGSLSNIDPSGTEAIVPVEYSYPKYRVDSMVTTPEVVTTPVILGTVQEAHRLQKRNVETGAIVKSQVVIVNKPIYGEVRQVMPVNTHMLQYVDAKSGKRLDGYGSSPVFHGTDDYLVPPETTPDFVAHPRGV